MSVPKAKALLTVCAALLLCGCGQALSEREIVRAVFFAQQQGQYSVCLLLADQNAPEGESAFKTASAAAPISIASQACEGLPMPASTTTSTVACWIIISSMARVSSP